MTCFQRVSISLLVGIAAFTALPSARGATPEDLLAAYSRESERAPDAQAGRRFFTSPHGGEWSCASCHAAMPTGEGRHASTGKSIAPLAPAFNPARFTQSSKVEKWFGRNCRDVLSRECSATEKADVMAWLLSLKP